MVPEASLYDMLPYMKEYFSEGFREYFTNPKNLLLKDPNLYYYIEWLL